jgi:hypothetical protein
VLCVVALFAVNVVLTTIGVRFGTGHLGPDFTKLPRHAAITVRSGWATHSLNCVALSAEALLVGGLTRLAADLPSREWHE